MADFLQKLIPQLTKQVVREEIPARERKPAAATTTTRTPARRRTTAGTAARAAASSNGRTHAKRS